MVYSLPPISNVQLAHFILMTRTNKGEAYYWTLLLWMCRVPDVYHEWWVWQYVRGEPLVYWGNPTTHLWKFLVWGEAQSIARRLGHPKTSACWRNRTTDLLITNQVL